LLDRDAAAWHEDACCQTPSYPQLQICAGRVPVSGLPEQRWPVVTAERKRRPPYPAGTKAAVVARDTPLGCELADCFFCRAGVESADLVLHHELA